MFYTFGASERNVLQCLRVLRSSASAAAAVASAFVNCLNYDSISVELYSRRKLLHYRCWLVRWFQGMAERLVLACLLLHMAFIYLRLGVFSTSRSVYSKHSASVFRLFFCTRAVRGPPLR